MKSNNIGYIMYVTIVTVKTVLCKENFRTTDHMMTGALSVHTNNNNLFNSPYPGQPGWDSTTQHTLMDSLSLWDTINNFNTLTVHSILLFSCQV